MPIDAPYPELDELMTLIGEAGERLSEIEASEGAAGNISVYMGWPIEPRRTFPHRGNHRPARACAGAGGRRVLVTGSGRRLREIIDDPAANLASSPSTRAAVRRRLYTSPRRLV